MSPKSLEKPYIIWLKFFQRKLVLLNDQKFESQSVNSKRLGAAGIGCQVSMSEPEPSLQCNKAVRNNNAFAFLIQNH